MTSWIELDRERLQANLRSFRDRLGPHRKLMAVVKSNAYGHGLSLVAPELSAGADWLGVNDVDEALALDALGLSLPILILGHSEPKAETAETIVRHGFRQVAFRDDVLDALSLASRRTGRTAYVHLKIETGLHRLGIAADELAAFARRTSRLAGIEIEGAYTHFADIENPESGFFREQLRRFDRALDDLAREGVEPRLTHAAPSAGVLLHDQEPLSLARVGIGLYGVWPAPDVEPRAETTLAPVLAWKCRIAQARSVEAGESVGYDRTYVAPTSRRIAVIPVGYFDGLDRSLSNRGSVLVAGRRAPIVGRVAMNMAMIDVTDVGADVAEDDEVVLIGEQGEDEITAEEVAGWADTIAYEVLARLGSGIPRSFRPVGGDDSESE